MVGLQDKMKDEMMKKLADREFLAKIEDYPTEK